MGNCFKTFSFVLNEDSIILFPICGSGRIIFLKDCKKVIYINNKSLLIINKDNTQEYINFYEKGHSVELFFYILKYINSN
jgi:hypothetical protein